MRRPTFEAVAAALRQRLGLTLFGFDLVFDRSAGELVIVDVNYFPSFKGIPEAAAALQAALRERYAAHAAGASASPHHA
jgi:inositol-1,3,4-trisphosphate 5/6-kinase/inositol-tetrakisphosphate 1-kinase